MNYRKDIDGLRAIAVLSVVGFHAFPDWIHGGFIGVDIFFIISGYLISNQIYSNLASGKFSVIDFYERRIRRIFPSLITVLLTALILGWFFLLPEELSRLAKHIIAGATFTSNLTLWSEAGYFDGAAITKPLLHLWSLGIEEQFYILWPLIILITQKKSLDLKKVLIALLICSFLLNILLILPYPVSTFYSPATRFWELLLGAYIAWIHTQGKNLYAYPRACNYLSWSAIALFIVGLFSINKDSAFPGLLALIPAATAALFILAGPLAFLNRYILSSQLLVGIGLISYPLYLWHWMLLSYLKLIEEDAWAVFELRLFIVILSIGLSALTYLAIEKPLRFGSFLKAKVYFLIAGMAAMIFISLITIEQQGFPTRSMGRLSIKNQGDIGHLEFDRYLEENFYPCLPESVREGSSETALNTKRCFQSKRGAQPQIAIIGDSHAEALFIGIAEVVVEKNVVYYNRDALPFINNLEYQSIYDYVLSSRSIEIVVLASYWTMRMKQDPLQFQLALGNTIEQLQKNGKEVILFDDVPAFLFSPKRCKYSDMIGGNICNQSRLVHLGKQLLYNGIFSNLIEKFPSTQRVDPSQYLCNADTCAMNANEKLLYRDTHHLNIFGSQYLATKIFTSNNPYVPLK